MRLTACYGWESKVRSKMDLRGFIGASVTKQRTKRRNGPVWCLSLPGQCRCYAMPMPNHLNLHYLLIELLTF